MSNRWSAARINGATDTAPQLSRQDLARQERRKRGSRRRERTPLDIARILTTEGADALRRELATPIVKVMRPEQVVTAGSDNVLGLWVLPPGAGHPVHVTGRAFAEHRVGTVSVEGELVLDGWHGFLEHGVWREA